MDKAMNAAQAVQNIINIIKAGLNGGWASAAVAALKAYWPKIVPIVIVILMLPILLLLSIPMLLFGFGGVIEDKATYMERLYDKYDMYRDEALNPIIENTVGRYNLDYDVQYMNDSLNRNWLVALHTVITNNDLDIMSESNLRDLIANTFRYEITVVENIEEDEAESENPWDDTTHKPQTPEEDENDKSGMTLIQVYTLSPAKIMDKLNFDGEHRDWAVQLYESYLSYTLYGIDGNTSGDNNTSYIKPGYISPFPNIRWQEYVTSEFGTRKDPFTGEIKEHKGMDLAQPLGTEIHAVADGTATYVGYDENGYGNYLQLNHSGNIVTLYAHCSEILVKKGDVIKQGDVIALVGSTSNSTGPHLHLEFLNGNIAENPRFYLPIQEGSETKNG